MREHALADEPKSSDFIIGTQNLFQRRPESPSVRDVFKEISMVTGNIPTILALQEIADTREAHPLLRDGAAEKVFRDHLIGEHRALSTIFTEGQKVTHIVERNVHFPPPKGRLIKRAERYANRFRKDVQLTDLQRGAQINLFEIELDTGQKIKVLCSNVHLSLPSHGGHEQKLAEMRFLGEELAKMKDAMDSPPDIEIVLGDFNTNRHAQSDRFKAEVNELREAVGSDFKNVTADIPYTLDTVKSVEGMTQMLNRKYIHKAAQFAIGLVYKLWAPYPSRRKFYQWKTDHAFVRTQGADWEIGTTTVNDPPRELDHKGILITFTKKRAEAPS